MKEWHRHGVGAAALGIVLFVHFGASWGSDIFPDATWKTLERLKNAQGTLRGMHDTIGGDLADGFDVVSEMCGKRLALWSSDFGYSTHPNDSIRLRPALLEKIKALSEKNILITLSWHQCNPTLDEPCTFTEGLQQVLSEDQWSELLTDGSPLNTKWKGQIDRLSGFLEALQAAGVTVLLRPYHEPNIPSFWWHHEDPQIFKALWNQLRSHFLEARGLKSLLWVWSVSYHPNDWNRVADYYPGDDVVDVVGLDIYPPAHDKAPDFEKAWVTLKQVAPAKPLALTEVSRLPSSHEMNVRNWAYVVPWGKSMLLRDNSLEEIKAYCGEADGPTRVRNLILENGR